jgi:parvulin-like peptidyl-prolyl isomerase
VAKKRRQTKIPTPAWDTQHGAIGRRLLGRSFQFYGAVVTVVLIVAALGVIGYAFWEDEAEKRGRPGSTAVQIEDTKYRLDYYSARLKMYVDQVGGPEANGAAPGVALPAVAETLVREQVIRDFAEELDVSASDDEIKAETATRLGIAVDDESFDTVYEQELARTGLTDEQYRDMVEATVLTNKLLEHFTAEQPETAEAVNYRQIVVSTQEEADGILAELEGGADFKELAGEKSLDTAAKETGGEVGWSPKGASPALDEALFAAKVGEPTTIPGTSTVLVVEVTDKDDAFKLEEGHKANLASVALNEWIGEKRDSLTIVNNMDINGEFDQDKVAWAISRVYPEQG